LVPDGNLPTIPDSPNRADAETALETLLVPFKEFPFVSEHDRAVHLACILTAIQRPALNACPIFGYTAPAQRSGKSLLAESVAIIATGKPAAATAMSSEREEIRKMITSALREAHSIINLDNVERPLASPDLAKAITQPEYQDRALGTNRMLRLPTRVLWTATGNNLSFRGDLSSRALLCRIDAQMESPEVRTFQIPRLRDFIERDRQDLVAAALTILRAYHVAGRPRQDVKPWGGFEDWSASIREPLVWLGLADPCETRSAVLADDPEREESLAVLRALREEFEDGKFTAKRIVRHCESNTLRVAIEAVALGRNKEVDSRKLGWWLRRNHNRIIGGLRLESKGSESGSSRWRIVEPSGVQSGHGGQSLASRVSAVRIPGLGNTPARDGTIKRFPRLPNTKQIVI
jgi:putative DNA primase/helicase